MRRKELPRFAFVAIEVDAVSALPRCAIRSTVAYVAKTSTLLAFSEGLSGPWSHAPRISSANVMVMSVLQRSSTCGDTEHNKQCLVGREAISGLSTMMRNRHKHDQLAMLRERILQVLQTQLTDGFR